MSPFEVEWAVLFVAVETVGEGRQLTDADLHDIEVVITEKGGKAVMVNLDLARRRKTCLRYKAWREVVVYGPDAEVDRGWGCDGEHDRSVLGIIWLGLSVGVEV